jgi:hypothetical protein
VFSVSYERLFFCVTCRLIYSSDGFCFSLLFIVGSEINRKSMFVMKEYLNYFWNIL